MAASVDGFVAGEGDDLSWLPQPGDGPDDGDFEAFLAQIGALLMGRRTFDVVEGFGGAWPYGERPVLVATRRPLEARSRWVRQVAGAIDALIDEARAAAGGRDVYVDGGALTRQALDAGLVDELTVFVVPVVLGRGVAWLAGAAGRHPLRLVSCHPRSHGMVRLVYAPIAGPAASKGAP